MLTQVRRRSRKLIALAAFFGLVASLTAGFGAYAGAQEQEAAPQPTISSDLADYPPGATVILTGSNWQPGESVHINVNDELGKSWSRDVDVTADGDGNVRDEFQLPDWFVAQYQVTATGAQSSVATSSFTDAALKLQGKSDPQCTSGGQCDFGFEGGTLGGWKELDEIPMRLKFASTGNYTVNVEFDHTTTSGARIPGIQNLRNWTAGSGVTLTESPNLYDISGAIWTYRVKVNVASANAVLNFNAKLAAGSHNYPGGSLDVRADNAGGVLQITKPGVGPGSPDLAVDKTGPASAAPGETVTYTLNYQNKAGAANRADGAQLTDVLPAGVTYVGCSDTCQVAGNEVIWDLGVLTVSQTGSRSLQVRLPQNAPSGAQYTDFAQVLSEENDAAPADNQDTLTTTVQSNRAPDAVNDSLTSNEDTAGTVNVLANDTDPDGNTLTVTGNTQPTNGSVTRSGGTVTYAPNANYNGSDSFTYTISDGNGGTNTATVNVTVNPVNDAPEAQDDSYGVDEDGTLTVPSPSVLGNDSDIDGGSLTAARTTGPASGTLNLNADGSFVYTPRANFNGPDSFTYTVSDGKGGTDTATANITVRPVDDTPVAKDLTGSDDGIVTPEDTPKGITLTASDADSTNLTFTIVGGEGPTNGTLTGSGPDRTYAPSPNYNGPDAFTFRVCDNSTPTPLCDTGEVEIQVTPVNDAPIAADDDYSGDEGQTLTVNAPGLLANDSDEETPRSSLEVCEIRVQRDGSAATVGGTNITIRNDEGTLTSDGTGAFAFDPADPDYFGSFSFQYRACDAGNGESAYATVTVTVNNVNDAPRVDLNGSAAGAGDAATFSEGGGAVDVDTGRDLAVTDVDNASMQGGSVTLLNRKAGDVISVNETLAGNLGIGVANGSATTGAITLTGVRSKADYQALMRTVRFNNNSQNPDTTNRNVEFEVTDNGGLASNRPDSVVTVIEVNDAPDLTASNDGPIDEGGTATITGTTTDPDTPAGELRYQFDCDDNGTYERQPAAGVNTAQCSFDNDGDYAVNVRVLDGEGGSDTASTVVKVNNVPPTVSGPENANQGSNEGQNAAFELGSFADPGADGPWSVTVNWGDGSTPTTFNANAPGSLGQRQHAYDDNDTYDVTFTVDEAGAPAAMQTQNTNSATFTATVANVAPTATLDAPASVDEGDDISFSLINPSDPSGADRQAGFEYAFKCGDGSYGAFGPTNASNCPTTDNGDHAVSAKLRDKDGGETEYTGAVVVNNAAPKVTSLTGPTLVGESTTLERTYNFNARDAGDDALTIEVGCGLNGEPVDSNGPDTPGGTYAYDPTTGDGSFKCIFADGGPASSPTLSDVKIRVTDEDGATDAENRTVSVTVDNDDPRATFNAPASANEGDSFEISLTDASDPAGNNDTLSYRFDCGDGNGFGPYGAATSLSCPTVDEGTLTVRAQVADEDGGESPVYEKTVTVNNTAPRISLTGPGTADEGDTKRYEFAVTDAGANDTHTVDRSCGSGRQEVNNSFAYDANTRTGSFECRFPDGPAVTNVTATATDNGGLKDADDRRVEVTVANVVPTVKLQGPDTANEGDTEEYTFEISDPGADDQAPEADCGDGTPVPHSFRYDAATGTGSFECRFPDVTPEQNLVTPVSVTTNDGNDAGSDSKNVSVLNVAPKANDDSITTTELREVKANLLDNDEDPGQDLDRASMTLLPDELSPNANNGAAAANVTSSLLTAGGSVSIDEPLDGNVTYTPNRGFVTTGADPDSFRYEVCDDDGDCSRANVAVEVGPVDCDAEGVIRGTGRADVLRGTAGDDVICAFGGNDRIYAGAGNDLLVGDAGWDRMWAETGNDVMRGGTETDTMDAGLGEDYLSGDAGRDIMMGRGDIDTLEMRDGSGGDSGNGGAGTDTCSRDAGDKAVSCERQ